MIPRIIHYCWFGKEPFPSLAKNCIMSWRKYCPDYEFREWNEENFDLDYCSYVREAYEEKKWAFVSDVVRLYALLNYGGIYMDTDVEVIKPLDDLLGYDAVAGFEHEKSQCIQTGFMASEANQQLIQEFLHEYDNIHFRLPDGSLNCKSNVDRITELCEKYGLRRDGTKQTIHGLTLLPYEYLCPKSYKTGKIDITKNTFMIHHFDGSWLAEEEKLENSLRMQFAKYLPIGFAGYVARFITVKKTRGLGAAIKETNTWLRKKL